MSNISVLVGLKNNLEYSKHFYNQFRKLYPTEEICFVSYGSTDGTNEWLDSLVDDKNTKYYYLESVYSKSKTFSDTFNKAAELATKDYILFCHNDIVVVDGFLENIEKHLDTNSVISYTTVEPPIFAGHNRPGKIIRDFGDSFKNLNYKGLINFIKKEQEIKQNQTSEGISFFMSLSRALFLKIGGFDPLFSPMFCEDDDLIERLKQVTKRRFTSLDALCYHFVSKTSRFSDEYKDKTKEIEKNSNRNYTRKWSNVYDIGLRFRTDSLAILQALEPYFSTIYTDLDDSKLEQYILDEQPKTKFDIKRKLLSLENKPDNDIVVTVDLGEKLEHLEVIRDRTLYTIPAIIENSEIEDTGAYKLDDFITVLINRLENKTKDLVKRQSIYYRNKLL